jgi:hypothetical protein
MRFHLFFLLAAVAVACETVIPQPPTADVVEEGDRIYIVDQDGKSWDVTHAVKRYNMLPENFQFGLGVNAIRPIIDPEMLCPGESGYPRADERIVIATVINGDARAYLIDDLNAHEVVDDTIGGVPLAVGW